MKTILITGATGGIGSALSLEYATSGVRLLLLARKEFILSELARECEALGAETHYYTLDLANTSDIFTLMSSIIKQFDIDLFISNAGVTNCTNGKQMESWEEINALLNINLVGALAVAHPVLVNMQSRKSGHIAYVSSLAAYYGMSLTPAYSASKAGLKAYAEAMRVLLAPSSISVTLITPGFVETAMSSQFYGNKPFIISSTVAAKKIKKGLDRRAKVVTFPLFLSIGMRLLSCLPATIADKILVALRY